MIAELEAELRAVRRLRTRREGQKAEGPFPPPGSLLEEWMKVLGEFELELLKATRELVAALKGHSERNLFDLLAVVNQLLDILTKLHQRADTISRYTLHAMDKGEGVPIKDPLLLPPRLLLGELASEKEKVSYPLRAL